MPRSWGDLALTCGMPLAGSSAVMSSTRMHLMSEMRQPVSIASLNISLQALDPSSSMCPSRKARMSSGISGVNLEQSKPLLTARFAVGSSTRRPQATRCWKKALQLHRYPLSVLGARPSLLRCESTARICSSPTSSGRAMPYSPPRMASTRSRSPIASGIRPNARGLSAEAALR